MAPAAELNHWACLFAERVQVAQAPPAQRLPLPRGGATEGRGPCNAESLEPPSRVGSQSTHFFRGARSLSSGPNPRRNTGGRPPAMAIHSGWKPGLGCAVQWSRRPRLRARTVRSGQVRTTCSEAPALHLPTCSPPAVLHLHLASLRLLPPLWPWSLHHDPAPIFPSANTGLRPTILIPPTPSVPPTVVDTRPTPLTPPLLRHRALHGLCQATAITTHPSPATPHPPPPVCPVLSRE